MNNVDNYVDIASLGIDTSKPFANLKIIVESVSSDFEVEDMFHVCVSIPPTSPPPPPPPPPPTTPPPPPVGGLLYSIL